MRLCLWDSLWVLFHSACRRDDLRIGLLPMASLTFALVILAFDSSLTPAGRRVLSASADFIQLTWVPSVYSQVRIDHGELIRWTKGFGAPNTEGHDVAAMFRKSLEKFVSVAVSLKGEVLHHLGRAPRIDLELE